MEENKQIPAQNEIETTNTQNEHEMELQLRPEHHLEIRGQRQPAVYEDQSDLTDTTGTDPAKQAQNLQTADDPTTAYTTLAKDGTNPSQIENTQAKESLLQSAANSQFDVPDPTIAYTALASDHTNPTLIEKAAPGLMTQESRIQQTSPAVMSEESSQKESAPTDMQTEPSADDMQTESAEPSEEAFQENSNMEPDQKAAQEQRNADTEAYIEAGQKPVHHNAFMDFFRHPWVGIGAVVCCLGLVGAVIGYEHHVQDLNKALVQKTVDLTAAKNAYMKLDSVNKLNEAQLKAANAVNKSYKSKLEAYEKQLSQADSQEKADQKQEAADEKQIENAQSAEQKDQAALQADQNALNQINAENGTVYSINTNGQTTSSSISYQDLANDPSEYAGDQVTLKGTILAVDNSGSTTKYLVALTSQNGDQMLVVFPGSGSSSYKAGDKIQVTGSSTGLGNTTYQGTQETIPMVSANEMAAQ